MTPKESADSSLELQALLRLYQRWDEVRANHAEAGSRAASEEKRLRGDGSFLVGALKQASGHADAGGSIAASAALQAAGDSFYQQASERLKAETEEARRRLEADADALGASVAERILGRKVS